MPVKVPKFENPVEAQEKSCQDFGKSRACTKLVAMSSVFIILSLPDIRSNGISSRQDSCGYVSSIERHLDAIEPITDELQALLSCVPLSSRELSQQSPHNSIPSDINPMFLSQSQRRRHNRYSMRYRATTSPPRPQFSLLVLVCQ
jgi:hypothetical protein